MEPIQSKEEEKLNVLTHALGAVGGLLGVIILGFYYNPVTTTLLPILIYGISLVFLFTASSFYHYISPVRLKHKFRILDHDYPWSGRNFFDICHRKN